MKVVIDRAKWDVYPNKKPGTKLYDKFDYKVSLDSGHLLDEFTGLKCCIGFVGTVCGFSDEELKGKVEVHDYFDHKSGDYDSRWPIELVSNRPIRLMLTNDDKELNNEERESQIIRLGKQQGIEFEFVGEYLS